MPRAIGSGRWAAALVLALLASGCGGSGGDPDKTAARAPKTNVWSGELKTMDRARGVQQTLMKSAQQRREEIERQEGD